MARESKAAMAVMGLVLGLAAMPPALGQQKPTRVYEPNLRFRTGLEVCMKDEVMLNNGTYCVKKCQPDFRMDTTTRPPTCYALKPEARYVPPVVPQFTPPEKAKPRADPKGPV